MCRKSPYYGDFLLIIRYISILWITLILIFNFLLLNFNRQPLPLRKISQTLLFI